MTPGPLERVRFITESLGGSPLSQLAQHPGSSPAAESWFAERPESVDDWRSRIDQIRGTAPEGWWRMLEEAAAPTGAARERLTRVVQGGGAVVTTGQQPGLFGGPVYTWSKAMSALALADCLEAATGIPMLPVFWAATDDDDFAEAASTWLAVPGGARRLELPRPEGENLPLSHVSLGEVAPLVQSLQDACGSAADARPLAAVLGAYGVGATVGGAYVALLRELLGPMGIVVLDASHRGVAEAAHPLLVRALHRASDVERALRGRATAIEGEGFTPQVELVDGRTLVFDRSSGRRVRVTSIDASRTAAAAAPASLSPNVLLRPVVERSILPTVTYAAGPGELAYFAQVSAVADALDAPTPLAVPRWSVTILEPQVSSLLERYGLRPADLERADEVETRLARSSWPDEVEREYQLLRDAVRRGTSALRDAIRSGDRALIPPAAIDGLERGLAWRLYRLERRITAGAKRRESSLMHDLGTLRGALYPGGMRQERALNLIPVLARHGLSVLEEMLDAARGHAMTLVLGEAAAPAEP